MRRHLVALALAAGMWGCSREAAVEYPNQPFIVTDTPAYAARRAQLAAALPEVEEAVRATFESKQVPSMSIALLADGHVLWWRSYGNRTLGQAQPVTSQTVYRIGSLTKVVTGMAILKLRDEGALALDAPAELYLPELRKLRYPTADSPLVTLRHLLTHTSGLPRLGSFDYAKKRDEPVSEDEVLASLEDLRLDHAPGVNHEYSNLGFALVGLIVGRVSGMPYRQYATQHVLMPLGMRSAVWDHRVVPPDRLATGYALHDDGYRQEHHWLMGASEAMGGLYASLDDMVRLTAFQMTAWPPGGRQDLPPLRNASLRESHMLAGMQLPRGGSGIAWGVTMLGPAGHLAFHTGATAQYSATMMFLPQHRLAAVALASCGCHAETIDHLSSKLLRDLLRRVNPEAAARDWERPTPLPTLLSSQLQAEPRIAHLLPHELP